MGSRICILSSFLLGWSATFSSCLHHSRSWKAVRFPEDPPPLGFWANSGPGRFLMLTCPGPRPVLSEKVCSNPHSRTGSFLWQIFLLRLSEICCCWALLSFLLSSPFPQDLLVNLSDFHLRQLLCDSDHELYLPSNVTEKEIHREEISPPPPSFSLLITICRREQERYWYAKLFSCWKSHFNIFFFFNQASFSCAAWSVNLSNRKEFPRTRDVSHGMNPLINPYIDTLDLKYVNQTPPGFSHVESSPRKNCLPLPNDPIASSPPRALGGTCCLFLLHRTDVFCLPHALSSSLHTQLLDPCQKMPVLTHLVSSWFLHTSHAMFYPPTYWRSRETPSNDNLSMKNITVLEKGEMFNVHVIC